MITVVLGWWLGENDTGKLLDRGGVEEYFGNIVTVAKP